MSEILYEAELKMTGLTTFGTNLAAIWSGEVPEEGARFNLSFLGPLRGPLEGTLSGVNYLIVRRDGRLTLDLHGVVALPDERNLS